MVGVASESPVRDAKSYQKGIPQRDRRARWARLCAPSRPQRSGGVHPDPGRDGGIPGGVSAGGPAAQENQAAPHLTKLGGGKSPVNPLLLQSSQAVVVGEHGYMLVDYHRLGLRLQTWEEWCASNQSALVAHRPARG